MKLFSAKISISLFSILLTTLSVEAQQGFFKDAAEAGFRNPAMKRVIIPAKYRTLSLDTTSLVKFLQVTPAERSIVDRDTNPILEIPMPDGTTNKFRIWESAIMDPALAAQFPGIKTYTGQGIDDPTATIKVDWTALGFHAMILSSINGSVFIDPFEQNTKTAYISYYKSSFTKANRFAELPPVKKGSQLSKTLSTEDIQAGICTGTQLRTYRLAVACTGEYAVAATPTPHNATQTLSAIVTTVNRVVGVYEREVAIRMILVANESSIVYTSGATDPFNGNDDGDVLIDESQTVIDQKIGNANYDIGHTFSTGGGGIAGLGVVCVTGQKGSGVTGSSVPVGDPYDIDYVAHEMGHQFGANHPFNGTTGSCSGNGSQAANAEPGSGSTIMGYAGICTTQDLQANSDAQFHAVSFNEITNYTMVGSGSTCAVVSSTGNSAPVVNAGAAYTIPVSTPFFLTGSATDPNGDALTYSWEQVDVGGSFGPWNAPTGNAPLFRSFPPVATPTRYFPKLSNVISGTTTIGEVLPTYARTMHFRLTARDNKAGGGGVCYAETSVATTSSAGPFVLTSPTSSGITWLVNDFQTITWDPAGTQNAPVNCTNVAIQLSLDGGNTYPVTLSASTPNDGTEEIQVPNNTTSQARVRIVAVGNVFYDISNNNFTIQASSSATFAFNTPAAVPICGGASSGVTTIKTGALGSFSGTVALSASGNPGGTTVVFGSTSIAAGSSTTVTLNNTAGLAAGTYSVTVTGISGAITKTKVLSFNVSAAPASATLSTPANQAIGVIALPTFTWAVASGATSYTVEIATSNTFASIVQTIPNIAITSTTLTIPLIENTVYYWRVKSSNANCSAVSSSFLFKTGVSSCTIYTSTDVPKTIAAASANTVVSNLIIPAGSGATISDVDVLGLTGTHQWVADITVKLTSPANTVVTLFDQLCSDGNEYNNFGLNLDDEAATATFPCPPTGNVTVRPSQVLSAFDGQNSAGTWKLSITDNYAEDGGSLTAWQIRICSFAATPLATVYTFTGNGNWDVAANWTNNTIPPASLPAGAEILINPAGTGECVLNILQTIASGGKLTVAADKKFRITGNLQIN